MTDSANNNPKNRPHSFNEDLDAMLDKAKSSLASSDNREDDEDAIDGLLMADGLDAAEAQQADSSKDLSDNDNDLSDEFDDFSDDFAELILVQDEEEEKFDPFAHVVIDDEASASTDDEMPSGIEGFFEFDDFDGQAPDVEPDKPIAQARHQEAVLDEGYQDDDFPLPERASDKGTFLNLNNEPENQDTHAAFQETKRPEKKPGMELPPISMPNMEDVMAGIKPRRGADEPFISDSADTAVPGRFNPDQESINRLQKALRTEFESKTKKIRLFAYVAMGLSCVTLVSALGFGLMAYSAKKEALRLSELVATLEKAEGRAALQGSDQELDDIKSAIEQLNQRVDGIMEQLSNKVPLSTEAETNEPTEELAAAETEQDMLRDLQARLDALERKALAVQAIKPGDAKAEVIKPITVSVKESNTKSSKSTSGKVNTTAGWSVNLVAYRQQWYAKSKAAEFGRKGIPVEVVNVKVDNTIWYRLRVGGFKNREEATLYATKVKKTLNLSSVWVGNAQG
jgi:cell division protein FtsN